MSLFLYTFNYMWSFHLYLICSLYIATFTSCDYISISIVPSLSPYFRNASHESFKVRQIRSPLERFSFPTSPYCNTPQVQHNASERGKEIKPINSRPASCTIFQETTFSRRKNGRGSVKNEQYTQEEETGSALGSSLRDTLRRCAETRIQACRCATLRA